ncbi:MAG: hypothetical protein KC589_02325 [Nanoarchaeota archaeon]|nr:hypothetical protein [Nanoarchaeota archaeon]
MLVELDLISKKTSIFKFYKGKVVSEKNIVKKKLKLNKTIVRVKLEDGRYLLVNDVPLNFLLSYTIILGKESDLYQFELKREYLKDDEGFSPKYIAEKKITEILEKRIEKKSIKKIEAEELFEKKFEFEFEQVKIIKKLKTYSKRKNNLDLNKIHLIDSNTVENYLPNIKKKHYRMAHKIKIPLAQSIENNYIKDSSINIYNEKAIIEIIKPLFTYKADKIWDYVKIKRNDNKKELGKTYKDVKSELYLDIDTDEILEKIKDIEKHNFDLNKVKKQILNRSKILFSWEKSDVIIPLFKSIKHQEFVKIKDLKDFFEITGVEFELKSKKLKNIFIQNLEGEKAIFIDKYLNPKLEKAIDSLEISDVIEFKNTDELIIKIIFNGNKEIKELRLLEDININQINEVTKIIKYLSKITILTSIRQNKIPRKKNIENLYEEYYSSCCKSLEDFYSEYVIRPSKKQLLKNVLELSNKVMDLIRSEKINFEESYFLYQYNLRLLKILRIFDEKKSLEIEKLIKSYFKEVKAERIKPNLNKNVQELVNNAIFCNRLAKKYKTYVLVKKEIPKNLLDPKVEILRDKPIGKKYLRINKKKIRKTFPNLNEEIIKEIKKIDVKKVENSANLELEIKNKSIKLSQDYFNIFENFEYYRTVRDNEFFKFLVKK